MPNSDLEFAVDAAVAEAREAMRRELSHQADVIADLYRQLGQATRVRDQHIGATQREPALLAEVERRARNEARLVNAFESLIQDTDGGDVDGDSEIPVGEIRRMFHEATSTPSPTASCSKCGTRLEPCVSCGEPSGCGEVWCADHGPSDDDTDTRPYLSEGEEAR